MALGYEQIRTDNGLPLKVSVQQIIHFDLHWHDYYELVYVAKGSLLLHIGNEDYTLTEGQMTLITAMEIHSLIWTNESNLLVVIQFDPNFFSLAGTLQHLSFRRKMLMENQNANPGALKQITDRMKLCVFEYNKQPKGYQYRLCSMLFGIIAELLHNDYFEKAQDTLSDQSFIQNRILTIMTYMNSHYDEELSLKAIAEKEHISYYYLSRIFRETTGVTFRDYLCDIRLRRAQEALLNTNDSLLTIALTHGFSSGKSFFEAFHKRYHETPGKYRQRGKHSNQATHQGSSYLAGKENHLLYLSMDNLADLSYIYSMISPGDLPPPDKQTWTEEHTVHASLTGNGSPLPHSWSKIGAVGRASDLLRSEVQQQVRSAVADIGYRYLRFHGIFCDDMMVCNRTVTGELVYNWLYVDTIFDFILSCGAKPFLELSFTPPVLASSSATLFWWNANISKPHLGEWYQLIRRFYLHCVERYGMQEVSAWYAEVWNEPDYTNVFWEGTMQDYFQLYDTTAQAIKSVSPQFRVGGPVITSLGFTQTVWIEAFASHCLQHQIPLDFISFHAYGERPVDYYEKGTSYFPEMPQVSGLRKDCELEVINKHLDTLKRLHLTPEIHVTEWNVSSKQRFLIRDTAFMAPYVAHVALSSYPLVQSMTFWEITDLIEEVRAPIEPFHGGLGMLTVHGIPKPSYQSFFLLNKLGDTVLDQGESYIITRRGETYQLLVYNLVYLDTLAQSNLSFVSEYKQDLYTLFEERPALRFHFQLTLPNGDYRLVRYELNRQYGSCYDGWIAAGASSQPTQDELASLRASAQPRVSSEVVTSSNHTLTLTCCVPVHGCQLMMLGPVWNRGEGAC